MKHYTLFTLTGMKRMLIPTLVFTILATGCVVDSDEPQPDSTHVFIVSIDKMLASLNCNSGNGNQAIVHSKIEIFVSTREDGTPSKPVEKADFEPVTLQDGVLVTTDIEIEADFALADDVLIEARITAYDTEGNFSLEEEFWHSAFYDESDECWYNNRSLNPFSGCIPGSDSNSELFDTPHSTSMAGPDCQVFFEWAARIERM